MAIIRLLSGCVQFLLVNTIIALVCSQICFRARPEGGCLDLDSAAVRLEDWRGISALFPSFVYISSFILMMIAHALH